MDPYEHIVQLYDLEHDAFEDDASFFVNLIQSAPVLEIGCGSGRIVERLARAGLETHGIDSSPAMLRAARERLGDLPGAHVHLMSAQALDLPHTFPSVVWPLNVLWHLADESAQIESLQAARRHMPLGGLLVLDLSNPLNMLDRQDGKEIRLRFRADLGASQVQAFSCAEDFAGEQVLELSLWYDLIEDGGAVKRTATDIRLRYTYRYELELMLGLAGFGVRQIYGSYDLEAYTTDSPNLLVVATAR